MEDEECAEMQKEELEVLHSIYEGDSSFTVLSNAKLQYKFGDKNSTR